MATKKPAAKKKAAQKRTEDKTEVQTDRQRSAPEKPDTNEVEGAEETRAYTPEELAELEHAQRVIHNERTGGGTVREGELEAQREEHNTRVSRGFKF